MELEGLFKKWEVPKLTWNTNKLIGSLRCNNENRTGNRNKGNGTEIGVSWNWSDKSQRYSGIGTRQENYNYCMEYWTLGILKGNRRDIDAKYRWDGNRWR